MAEQMEIMLKASRKSEAEEILRILNEMTISEQSELLIFMRGMAFAKEMENTSAAAKRKLF